jgi:hypothetical protein
MMAVGSMKLYSKLQYDSRISMFEFFEKCADSFHRCVHQFVPTSSNCSLRTHFPATYILIFGLTMSGKSNSAHAIKVRAHRKKKDNARVAMARALTENFPMKELTTTAMPVEEMQGVSDMDFGGHYLTMVNCNNTLGGQLIIYLSEENDDDKTKKADQSNQHLFQLPKGI